MSITSSAEAVANQLRSNTITPDELIDASLARIQRRNSAINAFISVHPDKARRAAQDTLAGIRSGRLSHAFAGVPVAIKDLIDVKGEITTAGCELFAKQVATEDASVVKRLAHVGAITVGKTNLHELAYGTTSVNRFFGRVANPWNQKYHAGGSSGGSAAAVADGQVFAAIGTDTGGSIRIPAACCGVVGLKPTYGRISRHGVQPASWSHDHVGPITRTVRDAALLYDALSGHDPEDPATIQRPANVDLTELESGVHGTRIGILSDLITGNCHPEVENAVNRSVGILKDLGARAARCEWDEVRHFGGFAFVLIASETSARYQGELARAPGKISPDIAQLLEFGNLFLAHHYIQAQRARATAVAQAARIFESFDVLVTPTVPDPTEQFAALRAGFGRRHQYTIIANFLGLPAISVPCGLDSNGLPMGLQIIGPVCGESKVLTVARAYEKAAPWPHTPNLPS